MNPADSILEDTLARIGLTSTERDEHREIKLTQAEVDCMLEEAYNLGIKEGKKSLFHEEEDMGTQLFQQLMESLPDHVYFKDLQSRFICVNRSMATYHGVGEPSAIVGKSDFDFFESDSARAKFEDEQEIIRTGNGWSFKEELSIHEGKKERWVISSKLPLYDPNGKICGTFGLSRDITKQKNAEREVFRQRRLLETIVQILPCRLFLRDREGKFILVNQEYRKVVGIPNDLDITGKLLTDVINDPRADRVLAEDLQVVESGEAINNKLEYDKSILAGNRWVLTSKVPLRTQSDTIEGIVGMSLDITEQKKAEELARNAKEALQAKNEQYEEELLVARQLQEQLMSMGFNQSRMYSKDGDNWSFRACYIYKPSHHLAGDFFYLIPVDENRIGVLVCDVMGHGVKAALVTMLIRGLMTEIPDILGHPSKVLQHLNETILSLAEDEEFPRFVTAAYLIVDLEHGEAIMANGGHPCPILKNTESDFLECPCDIVGPALGLLGGEPFGDTKFSFGSESELFLFTDGIIEQCTSSGQDFGKDGLIHALGLATSRNIGDQLEQVKTSLSTALEGRPSSDDICVVALKLTPNA
ncbi:SpoIIE family protein phosphatase [Pelagicoccus sp. SDUM812002]|uniref:SpoIIE family protein phosphatase n=1 Tax=Pelagicoccus sp. SDUM812002 TaxID=3041266 RepID=UPI00280C8A33|nr:SpoIIE family protein phosphatase [Pelagicoccus sp. SDUM812002]MDQ8186444.1 SpoIIE family protein phosphatase [Pelagicoccus sp. SDUM812002]